jgi:hypothetical protein
MENYDVIVAVSFGMRKNEPGLSNISLAEETIKAIRSQQRPAIVQSEIYDLIQGKLSPIYAVFEAKNPGLGIACGL